MLRENVPERFNFFLARNRCRGIVQKGIANFMHNAQDQRTATPNRQIVQNTQYTADQIVQKVERKEKRKKGLQSEKYLL